MKTLGNIKTLTSADATSELLMWQVLKKKIEELERELERKGKAWQLDWLIHGWSVDERREKEIQPLVAKYKNLKKRIAVIERDFNL